MKKTLALLSSFICVLSFSACCENVSDSSSKSITDVSESKVNEQETISESESETNEDSALENTDGKTLVVYYSASGNTEEVAQYIADETNGDLFEIQPVDMYSSADLDWTDENSRVCREYQNPDLRNIELVSTDVANWNSYDTVFIGYPIWWGEASWVVNNFIKENDFSNKNVIPFCTSASSGLGESGKLLEEMAGSGNWQDGERFRSGASKSDVKDWVDSLKIN